MPRTCIEVPVVRIFAAVCWIGAVAASSGCPSDYTIKNIEDDASTIEYSNTCADLCSERIISVGWIPGCQVLGCGVGAGGSVPPGVSADLLEAGPNGTCQIVIECPADTCHDNYLACVQNNGDTETCSEVYDDCVLEQDCASHRVECEHQAEADYEECQNLAGNDCEFWYEYDMELCGCLYEECVRETELDCGGLAQLAPPPTQTSPQRWTVTRRLIDQELARLDALAVETSAWPIAKDGRSAGVRIGSLEPGDTVRELGIHNGDIITQVNGVAIGQAVQDPDWLLSLRDSNLVVLKVRRGAATAELKYDIVP